ncbi:helix-hairpin-helix domain-containing protein [Streptococcus sp. IsoGale022]|uniref:helix-hairpin-helix domain-containing protein n=1 Tax=Streptococcus sp. IsoGale022 TaxID=2923524 RepID=UPI00280DD231|nr:helix-hairpin-helix domain-containing protein [Streptococcus sp. IsoGale022]MDQ8693101.1 helix-hairpin-helix domain-containing protein [Streptococcus sp. IsoGale022]
MLEEIIEKLKEYKFFVGLVVVGAVLGGFLLIKGNHQPQNQVAALSQEVTSSSSSTEEEEEKVVAKTKGEEESEQVTVDIKGAVKNPGVYELRAGARVHEAIQKAGGLTADAEAKSINQAQKLTDEAVVYVAKIGEEGADVTQGGQHQAGASDSAGASGGKSDKVNLNTATEAELQTISGIGQKRASDIIAYRESNGRFKSVDDLKKVSGIGDKTLEKLKEYVTVD